MTMPSKQEQRHWSRVKLSCLVRARPSQPTVEEFDEVLATVNSCRGGFYFATGSARYKKHLRLFVTFPYSDALGAINRDYIGEVVRVDDLPDGGKGIAVNLLTTIGLAMQNHPSTLPQKDPLRFPMGSSFLGLTVIPLGPRDSRIRFSSAAENVVVGKI
jgi:hypothetical protein